MTYKVGDISKDTDPVDEIVGRILFSERNHGPTATNTVEARKAIKTLIKEAEVSALKEVREHLRVNHDIDRCALIDQAIASRGSNE